MTKEMTMTKTKAKTLRSDLGYTDADLAELKNVVCNGDQAADLPPFPRPADYAARRAIYQFLQKHGKYAPMFAWCRSKEIWRQSEETPLCGKRTSELYADDTEAKIRHWQLANTQEQFYNAMLAIEAYIVRDISETWCRVKDERKGFDKQLKSLSTTIRGGEWGAVPPSEVAGLMPPDRIDELNAKKQKTTGKVTMTVVQIAALFGVTRRAIYNWIAGEHPVEWPTMNVSNDVMKDAAKRYKSRRELNAIHRTEKPKTVFQEGVTEKYM